MDFLFIIKIMMKTTKAPSQQKEEKCNQDCIFAGSVLCLTHDLGKQPQGEKWFEAEARRAGEAYDEDLRSVLADKPESMEEEIKDILKYVFYMGAGTRISNVTVRDTLKVVDIDKLTNELLALFSNKLKEIIGEDEDAFFDDYGTENIEGQVRNQLRAEMRQKIKNHA
jgi:DNA-binding ferritin-like protein (Dps family)